MPEPASPGLQPYASEWRSSSAGEEVANGIHYCGNPQKASCDTMQRLTAYRLRRKPGVCGRSGLTAAVYLFKTEGQRAEEASRQWSLLYGHFPDLRSQTGAMDRRFYAMWTARPITPPWTAYVTSCRWPTRNSTGTAISCATTENAISAGSDTS
jgi:hypothetical protein